MLNENMFYVNDSSTRSTLSLCSEEYCSLPGRQMLFLKEYYLIGMNTHEAPYEAPYLGCYGAPTTNH
jgi:hypothetical protein